MKTLIVYYSMGGNCDFASREIARRTGAALLRIEPEKAYPDKGFAKFFWGGKSAVMAEKPALSPYRFDADACDRIVFGFPVWAGNVTPPIRSFIEAEGGRIAGKRICAFACQSGAGAEKAFSRLRDCLGGAALEAELVLIDPKDKPSAENEARLARFCEALGAEE